MYDHGGLTLALISGIKNCILYCLRSSFKTSLETHRSCRRLGGNRRITAFFLRRRVGFSTHRSEIDGIGLGLKVFPVKAENADETKK